MRASRRLFGLGLALAGLGPAASAQVTTRPAPASNPAPATDPARGADARAIADVVTSFTRAFEAGDARAVAATFTGDAQVSDEAGSTRGRPAIEARFAAYFASNPRAKIVVKVDALRFVSPDVAIEDGSSTIRPDMAGSRPEMSRYSVVYVRQDGKWLQSSLRDFPAEEPAVPDRLKELDWLVGDWVNENSEQVVHTRCNWTEDRHYLLREFDVKVAGNTALKGVQRIGWDPSLKQVRSWVFDSEGGFSEGEWSRSGDRWVIRAQGVHHDGKRASATMTIDRLGPNALRWKAYDRTLGGEHVAEADEYTMVRRPPAAGGLSARDR